MQVTSIVSCVKENDRTVWLLKELVRVSIQWLVTEIGTNGSLNKIDAHCGEGSSTGLSCVLCTEALRAFVLECLHQDTGCRQLWKMKCFPLGHREDVFVVQYNKDNVSLRGKGWTGVFTASYPPPPPQNQISWVWGSLALMQSCCMPGIPPTPMGLLDTGEGGAGKQEWPWAVLWAVNSFVSDLGVSFLLPESLKLAGSLVILWRGWNIGLFTVLDRFFFFFSHT